MVPDDLPPVGNTCDGCRYYGLMFTEGMKPINHTMGVCCFDVVKGFGVAVTYTRPKCAACECYEIRGKR